MDKYLNCLITIFIGVFFITFIILLFKIILQEVRLKRYYKSYYKKILYMRAEEAGKRRKDTMVIKYEGLPDWEIKI